MSLYEYFIRLYKLFKCSYCLGFVVHAVNIKARLNRMLYKKKIQFGHEVTYLLLVQYYGKLREPGLYLNRDWDSMSFAHVQRRYNCKIVGKEYRNKVFKEIIGMWYKLTALLQRNLKHYAL